MSYANGYFDTSTNLYKYGARYYNPDDARWTQLDPSGQDFGYLYSGDNPVNFVDPSGLALTNQYLLNASNNYSVPSSGQSVSWLHVLDVGATYAGNGQYAGGIIGCIAGGALLSPAGVAGVAFGCGAGYETWSPVGYIVGGVIGFGVGIL